MTRLIELGVREHYSIPGAVFLENDPTDETPDVSAAFLKIVAGDEADLNAFVIFQV